MYIFSFLRIFLALALDWLIYLQTEISLISVVKWNNWALVRTNLGIIIIYKHSIHSLASSVIHHKSTRQTTRYHVLDMVQPEFNSNCFSVFRCIIKNTFYLETAEMSQWL